MRCTPPMKAPCPPPTIPIRSLRFQDSMFRLAWPQWRMKLTNVAFRSAKERYFRGAKGDNLALQPQYLPVLRHVGAAAGEVVEGDLRRLDEVPRDERRTFGRPL